MTDRAVQHIIDNFTPEEIVSRLDELWDEQSKLEKNLAESHAAMKDFRIALSAIGKENMWP